MLDFDRSKAQKTAWNAKKAVDNKADSGIIKEINKYQCSAEKYPTSQDEIDNILKGPLNNVKMSADVLYDPRLRTSYGQTKYTLTHKVKINAIEVGKQGEPGTTEIIDTIIHEKLEARIYNVHITNAYRNISQWISWEKKARTNIYCQGLTDF